MKGFYQKERVTGFFISCLLQFLTMSSLLLRGRVVKYFPILIVTGIKLRLNDGKWGSVERSRGNYTWTGLENIYNYAMSFIGTCGFSFSEGCMPTGDIVFVSKP